MSDILKFIRSGDPDSQDRLLEVEDWCEADAERLARAEGIELTAAHWDVIRFVRRYYRDHGEAHNARELLDAMAGAFVTEGGKKHLYRLFPHGPVTQCSKLAGLPVPEHSRDASFGITS